MLRGELEGAETADLYVLAVFDLGGGHFCFATEQEENQGPSANGRQAQGPDDAGAAREAGGGSVGPGSRARPGGEVTLSMDVHVGKIADFRVNSVSRDIVSGGDRGHVHVFSFDPEMAGIPSMKVSKYVGCPVSSVRWHPGLPTLITWTTSKGHLQMLDIRDNRIVLNIPADDMMPIHTHEHLSEGVMAVGCDNGGLQLLDSRKISAFLTLHDPVAGAIRQILPFGGEDCLRDVGASGWAAFGCGGFSRYSVCADQMCGAAPSVVPSGINGVATGTAELALDATCRTAALNLDAGLFLASPSQGHQDGRFQEQQLCGISRHFSILTLSKNRPQSPAAGGERPSRQVRRS